MRVNNEPKLIFSNACQVDFRKLLLFAQYNELRNIWLKMNWLVDKLNF